MYFSKADGCILVKYFCILKDGSTALMFAAERGDGSIAEILLAAGANKDLQDNVSTL